MIANIHGYAFQCPKCMKEMRNTDVRYDGFEYAVTRTTYCDRCNIEMKLTVHIPKGEDFVDFTRRDR